MTFSGNPPEANTSPSPTAGVLPVTSAGPSHVQAGGCDVQAAAVAERSVHPLTIARRRGGGVRVLAVQDGEPALVGRRRPERLAGPAVEGEDELRLGRLVGRGQEHAVAD